MSRTSLPVLPPVLLIALLAALPAQASIEEAAVLWPERQRAFIQDGPGLLLSAEQRAQLESSSREERQDWIDVFLAQDPVPATPENELALAIERRRRLVRSEFLTLSDERARLLFLQGAPDERFVLECGITFKPLEIWTYGGAEDAAGGARLVLYQPSPDRPYRMWLPLDSKRPLYVKEMEYWLEQWEEYTARGMLRVKRFDLQACPETPRVDVATGVEALHGFRPGRPTNKDLLPFVKPPADLAAWARRAAATPLPEAASNLALDGLEIFFPTRLQQRLVAQFRLSLPAASGLAPTTGTDKPELIVAVDGVIEQGAKLFDEFRVRFKLEAAAREAPIALVLERPLRPKRDFVVRLRVRDEVGGAETLVSRGFTVPAEPVADALPPVPEGTVMALGQQLAREKIAGEDGVLLIPPSSDIVLGLWRAEALVTGSRIEKVVFLVDGKPQMTRGQRPFTAELRLEQFPTEQMVRAEGYDADDNLVAVDEVVLNRPTGALQVRIVEPRRGTIASGRLPARAELRVPQERQVESVDFLVNEELIVSLTSPPWQAEFDVASDGPTYLTVVATLDDGSRAEEVRFVNAPAYLEQVEVNLVELYTTVMDRNGRLVRGLAKEDFAVSEDGRPQEIGKFELVENLPLTVGFTIDTSGSMVAALPEARRAALGFLDNMLTPRDRAFAVAFSDQPVLLVPPTDDVTAVGEALEDLRSVGWTTLHDAVVTSLYYFRGVKGRRALILLSDGDDTASSIEFHDALEYARRSGVAVFCIGIDVGGLKVGIRRKLTKWAEESGGRVFFISKAEELQAVYQEIEDELRSQYLVAYTSDRPIADDAFRAVEVKVKDGKLKARTMSGYYP